MSNQGDVLIEGMPRLDEDEVLDDEEADDVGELGGSFLLGPLPDIDADRSVATTQLATEVGSVMGLPKTPFLKSFTIQRRQNLATETGLDGEPLPAETALVDWGSVELKDVKVKRKNRVVVQKLQGLVAREYSGIVQGDYIHSIDLEKVSGLDAEAVKAILAAPTELPYFCLASTFPTDNDVWVQATVIKPDPDMTLEEMGMTVWFWGYLCIKVIEKDSIFRHTVLKSRDHIVSINNIVCDKVNAKGFAHIVKELDSEITICVLRRKQRFSGMFN